MKEVLLKEDSNIEEANGEVPEKHQHINGEAKISDFAEDTRKGYPVSASVLANIPVLNEKHKPIWNSAERAKVLPKIDYSFALSPQVTESMKHASEVVAKLYSPQMLEAASKTTRIMQSINSMLDPVVFENAREISTRIKSSLPDYLDWFKALSDSFRDAFGNITYLSLLDTSQWPLYLSDDESLVDEIKNLSVDDDQLAEKVADIAIRHLDESWVEDVRNRWTNEEDLLQGEMAVLGAALDYHLRGEYLASVSLLMCMIEGLVYKYTEGIDRLEMKDVELFNYEAKAYGLNALKDNGVRGRNGFYAKDKIVLMLMQVDSGFFVWDSACSYLIKIVLFNGEDDSLLEHHPLRNKICHGSQTNFGTIEHSLKAILAVDLAIRLGRVMANCKPSELSPEDSAE